MPTDDELHYTIEQAKLHDGPADGPLQYAAQAAQELLDARAELTRLRALTAVPEDLRAVAVRAACDDYNGAMPACEWPACGCTSDGTARYNPTVSIADAILAAVTPRIRAADFQSRVQPWMLACFGPEISADRMERNHRFLEEALELVQANGCTQDEARQLVGYVYGRPQGDINQEVGGVMVTLAALCLANGEDMHAAGEKELARIWTKVGQIRAKQAAKPKHSPLPGPTIRAGADDGE